MEEIFNIIVIIVIGFNIGMNYKADTLKCIFWTLLLMILVFEYHINRVIESINIS